MFNRRAGERRIYVEGPLRGIQQSDTKAEGRFMN